MKTVAVSFLFVLSVILAITFGSLYSNGEIRVAKGILTAVDDCTEHCSVKFGAPMCFNVPVVSFEWNFANVTYAANNFTLSSSFCGDCCHSMVNKTVQVQIDQKKPSVPIRLWDEKAKPYSIPFLVLLIIFAILASFSGIYLVYAFYGRNRTNYQSMK